MINVNPNDVVSSYLFLPLNSFKGNFSDKISIVESRLLSPAIDEFFKILGKNKRDFDYLDYSKLFTDADFKNKEFSYDNKSFVQHYIYDILLADIVKMRIGKIEFKPKYCITFDLDLIDNNKGYGVFKLGNVPILYFIYISFQDFLSFIKSL